MTDIYEIYRQWLENLESSGQGTNLYQQLLTPLLIQDVIKMNEMQLVEAKKTSSEKNVVRKFYFMNYVLFYPNTQMGM